ncbi:LysR family transcriptional regulator [Qiania dongpingensis]|uniref:LysR family transcriptional regulator n=1 Tax=Qiania dongpingensis TaxID=2763669 RepID=A0A7G9G2R6_9FIRM|nr:LysR family transcriptional regulator [Qiania dongpingensis]QNM05098.1 LysR family transcriptional regulator [Qiania dongpingensis]
MTIRHLKIFVEVADTGKMSAAAERCFISQPTVSQTIRELEEHYQVKLFERLSKRLFITEEGKMLLTYARQVIRQFDELEAAMFLTGRKRLLKLGASVTVGNCLLSGILEALKKERPETEVYTCVNNTAFVEEQLLKAELDVGVLEGRVKSPELVSIPMIQDYLVLACGKEHPFFGRKELTLQDLHGQQFLMREGGSGTRALFESFLESRHVNIRICGECASSEAMKEAVMKNGCLAVLSIRLILEEIEQGSIGAFGSSTREWDRSFKIVYHKNKFIGEDLKALEKILHTYREPELPPGKYVGILQT